MIVAIDGPAGSGKSTVAKAVAKRRLLTFLDTGAMYRAVTHVCLTQGVDVSDAEAVTKVANDITIEFGASADGEAQTIAVNGVDATAEIRTAEVDRNVSAVSAVPAVREAMVALQRKMGAEGDVVAEGRDIGTVVFPNADVKVFLTADAEARAHRRAVQRTGADAATDPEATTDAAEEQQILDDLKRRDELDSSRETSPLKPAEDAVHIDSSNLTLEEVISQVESLMDKVPAQVESGVAASSDGASLKAQAPLKDGSSEVEVDPKAPAGDSAGAEEKGVEKGRGGMPAKAKKDEPTGKMRVFALHDTDEYLDRSPRDYPVQYRMLYGLVIGVLGGVTKLWNRWEIQNPELLAPAEDGRGRVVIMNHVSVLDPIVLYVHLYMRGIRPRGIYKSEFDQNPVLRWFLPRIGAIPVDRGSSDLLPIRRAQRALQRGEYVIIYPEGTRIRSEEQEVTIHGGFALMAQLAKATIAPTAIVGALDIKPKGTPLPKPVKVWVRCGEPVSFDDVEAKGRKAKLRAMEQLAMDRVYALRDALRKEHPGRR